MRLQPCARGLIATRMHGTLRLQDCVFFLFWDLRIPLGPHPCSRFLLQKCASKTSCLYHHVSSPVQDQEMQKSVYDPLSAWQAEHSRMKVCPVLTCSLPDALLVSHCIGIWLMHCVSSRSSTWVCLV